MMDARYPRITSKCNSIFLVGAFRKKNEKYNFILTMTRITQ